MIAHAEQTWPEVLTAIEAARYLRLDADHDGDEAAQLRAVQNCVRNGLRPVRGCGKQHRFTLGELRRWTQHQTEGSPENS